MPDVHEPARCKRGTSLAARGLREFSRNRCATWRAWEQDWRDSRGAMKLYGFPPTRTARVLWTLRELEVEFEYVQVDPTKGEHRRPEFLAVNPAGKLPALVDDDS